MHQHQTPMNSSAESEPTARAAPGCVTVLPFGGVCRAIITDHQDDKLRRIGSFACTECGFYYVECVCDDPNHVVCFADKRSMSDDLAEFLDRIGTGCSGRVRVCGRGICNALITNDPDIALRECNICDRMLVRFPRVPCVINGPFSCKRHR